jgi:hypothetical protein
LEEVKKKQLVSTLEARGLKVAVLDVGIEDRSLPRDSVMDGESRDKALSLESSLGVLCFRLVDLNGGVGARRELSFGALRLRLAGLEGLEEEIDEGDVLCLQLVDLDKETGVRRSLSLRLRLAGLRGD